MPTLPRFWHAAARLSGRLDLASIAAPGDLHTASPAQLAAAGLPSDTCLLLASGRPLDSPGPWLAVGHPEYPNALSGVPYGPPVLFYRGNRELLTRPGIALVGSRRCTSRGREWASMLARAAADAGASVISGMAWGIDTAAHLGAPHATVAVLGHGLGASMSARACRVRDQILDAGGLILTEHPPYRVAHRGSFPQRNRIIAGLSRLVIVVEAGARSGALGTARSAVEYGRDVAAVPHHPSATAAAGNLILLREGAQLLCGPEDLTTLANLPNTPHLPSQDPIIRALGTGRSFDDLQDIMGVGTAALSQRLAELELTGVIHRLPGDRYAPRTRK